jgi:hypothetical protein
VEDLFIALGAMGFLISIIVNYRDYYIHDSVLNSAETVAMQVDACEDDVGDETIDYAESENSYQLQQQQLRSQKTSDIDISGAFYDDDDNNDGAGVSAGIALTSTSDKRQQRTK